MIRRPEDSWQLRPGDLPGDRVLAREPRLKGLDENPVFRFLLHRQRIDGRKRMITSTFIIVLAFSYFLANRFLLFRFGVIGWVGMMIAYVYILRQFTRNARANAFMWLVPRQVAADLALAAIQPEQFALGIWGSLVTRERLRRVRLLWGVLGALAIPLLFVPPGGSLAFMGGIACVIVFVSVTNLVLNGAAPAHVLPGCVMVLRNQRLKLEFKSRPGKAIKESSFLVARVLLLVLGIYLLGGLLFALIYFALVLPFTRLTAVNLSQHAWLLFPMLGVLAGMVGLAVATFRARRARRTREGRYYLMNKEIQSILDSLYEGSARSASFMPPEPRAASSAEGS